MVVGDVAPGGGAGGWGGDDQAELDFVVQGDVAGLDDGGGGRGEQDGGGGFEEEEGLRGAGGGEFGYVVAVVGEGVG